MIRSHKLTTSIKGLLVRFGRYAPETLPQPINPTLIFLPSPGGFGLSSAFADARSPGDNPMKALATVVSLMKFRRLIGRVSFMAISPLLNASGRFMAIL